MKTNLSRFKLAFLVAALLLIGSLGHAEPRHFRGVLVVEGAQVLASENAAKLFLPASVLKLVVVASVLHYLGPDHRQSTVLAATAPLEAGRLQGDLVLVGAGDPTWNRRFSPDAPHAALASLAQQAYAHGLRQVTGDLVLDVSRFSGPQVARAISAAERASWYGAPATALAMDENAGTLPVAPGAQVGAAGVLPAMLGPVELVNRIVTVGAERAGHGTLEFVADPLEMRLIVQGEYPLGEPRYEVEIALPQPERRVGLALLEELRKAGIQLQGTVRVSSTPIVLSTAPPLGRILSPPLSQWLRPILEESHNWYAEMLLRVLALEVKGQGRLDTGLALERDFLETVLKVEGSAFVLDDASGLSRNNLITPEALLSVLRWMQGQSWKDVVFDSMVRPGQGTLKGFPDFPILAKTGTLQNTVGLAGYLNPRETTPILFVVLLNHRPGDRSNGLEEIFQILRPWEKP